MRIYSVQQLKDIKIDGIVFPLSTRTQIILDKKNPSHKKEHVIRYKQGLYYGQAGDYAHYLDNEDLLTLLDKGMIYLKYSGSL